MGSMEDFMRGGPAKPRFKLDIEALEARFGAPLGPMLIALSEQACRLAPFEPWVAFEPLEMLLVYLGENEHEAHHARHPNVPENVTLFLETGIDLHCAGFVDEGKSLPLDQRPICFITEESDEPEVVAATLAAFLGMVAVAGAEAVAIEQSDGDWLEMREERMRDQPFKALSKELCSLPGVTLATKMGGPKRTPSSRPPPAFALNDLEPMGSGLERVRFLRSMGRNRQASEELMKQIRILVSVGDAAAPHQWQVLAELVKSMRPSLSSDLRTELERRGISIANS
jgi:hypothetical protein